MIHTIHCAILLNKPHQICLIIIKMVATKDSVVYYLTYYTSFWTEARPTGHCRCYLSIGQCYVQNSGLSSRFSVLHTGINHLITADLSMLHMHQRRLPGDVECSRVHCVHFHPAWRGSRHCNKNRVTQTSIDVLLYLSMYCMYLSICCLFI